ncbi:MAG TPA: hypothetical protein VLX44_07630 [Xanthobacteraceae bacterium]|nr:hypothetical protein [Xanthobacteraceae bacterium]
MEPIDVASAAPGRMFSAGLAHLLIGVAWVTGPILGFGGGVGESGEMRLGVVAVVVILWPLGIPILLRGLGLLQQSLGESGYFRASAEGIELRVGSRSLYAGLIGRLPVIRALPANPDTFAMRFPEQRAQSDGSGYVYRFRWNEIAAFDISMFALVIELHSGARLLLRRFYFVEEPVVIGRRLNEITQRLRAANAG